MSNQPTVKLLDRGTASSFWSVAFADKRYFATTYPDSRRVFLQTEKRRPLGDTQARKLVQVIRSAIDAVEG